MPTQAATQARAEKSSVEDNIIKMPERDRTQDKGNQPDPNALPREIPSLDRLMDDAKLPPIYRNASRKDFDDGLTRFGIPMGNNTVRYVSHHDCSLNRTGMFLNGLTGVGKTHFAAAVLREWLPLACWINRSFTPPTVASSARWLPVNEFILELKATMHRDSKVTAATIMERRCSANALVLDDVGAEAKTDYTLTNIYTLIDTRISQGRPTIVTSNLTLAQLNNYDSRLASRLLGMSYYRLVGPDRRDGELNDE